MPLPADALVLTAGLGTRLRPLTLVRAKPAIPVAGEPMVRRIIRWLVGAGVTRITLNLHHLPETIAAVAGDGSDLGARVRYSWEQPRVLGTAGGPRQALDIIGACTFFLINGDTLTNVDLHALAAAHAASGALVTLALTPNAAPHRYGGVLLSSSGIVTGVVPRGDAARGSFHMLGVQLAEREAFTGLAPGTVASSIGGVYDTLAKTRAGAVRGFVTEADFWDVGTIEDYWTTSMAFAHRPVESSTNRTGAAGTSIFWDDVEIGEGAVLDECIVTDRVHVPAAAHYRRSVLVQPAGGPLTVTPFEVSPR